ncbi:MAG: hypothetical protein HGA22_09150, partial [Clostridiales bacterium]|nr:hypothetical protein [Clostridiales bacterium]
LAAANSQDGNAEKGGSYVFQKGIMVAEFEDAAFTMKTGAANAVVVQTQYGFHVLMVEEKYAKGEPVSLRCATDYYEYGLSFMREKVYSAMLSGWMTAKEYEPVINNTVYDSIQ